MLGWVRGAPLARRHLITPKHYKQMKRSDLLIKHKGVEMNFRFSTYVNHMFNERHINEDVTFEQRWDRNPRAFQLELAWLAHLNHPNTKEISLKEFAELVDYMTARNWEKISGLVAFAMTPGVEITEEVDGEEKKS